MSIVASCVLEVLTSQTRPVDAIECGYVSVTEPRDHLVKGVVLDVSQDPHGTRPDCAGQVHTLHKNTVLYSYEMQCMLAGVHQVIFNGFLVEEEQLSTWIGRNLNMSFGDGYFVNQSLELLG